MGLQLELIREGIIGLYPVYTQQGNATVIYLRSGETVVPQGIKSVLGALARSYAIDLKAQRQQMKGKLFRGGNLPFYINAQRVFVPLKMRRARADKDVVYGYFDIDCLGEVEATGDGNCMLHLQDGRRIQVLSQPHTVERAQNLGRRLAGLMRSGSAADQDSHLVLEAASSLYSSFMAMAASLERIEGMISDSRYNSDEK